MIQIGRYKLGPVPLSMIVVFIVLSVCAVAAASRQARPEWPMPLLNQILINVGMALIATLVYGIFIHFAVVLIDRISRKTNK